MRTARHRVVNVGVEQRLVVLDCLLVFIMFVFDLLLVGCLFACSRVCLFVYCFVCFHVIVDIDVGDVSRDNARQTGSV